MEIGEELRVWVLKHRPADKSWSKIVVCLCQLIAQPFYWIVVSVFNSVAETILNLGNLYYLRFIREADAREITHERIGAIKLVLSDVDRFGIYRANNLPGINSESCAEDEKRGWSIAHMSTFLGGVIHKNK
ncbi:hypothetical protein [Breoghania sp.]|uniref:hypothetical protein n=1 Tax=Breoghania sp. TaxID=2065378 RepID=UPI0029C9C25B|nr:hypothetical protein [Breoghania sp.]